MTTNPNYPRATAAVFALLILIEGLGGPALAQATETCTSHGITYNCVTEELQVTEREVKYATNDTVFSGNANVSPNGVFDSWPTMIRAIPISIGSGVRVGAYTEMRYDLSHLNSNGEAYSVTPSTTLSHVWQSWANPDVTMSNLLPVDRFVVRGNSTVLMNGASSFFFRGAAAILPDVADHVLEIRNGTGAVVFRTTTVGNSEAQIIAGRAYYRLNLPLRSEVSYTFTEFVRYTDPAAPRASISFYTTPYQVNALGGDSFIGFPDDSQATRIPTPPGYSFIFTEGMGLAGIERLLEGNATFPVVNFTVYATGRPGPNATRAEFYVPMRHPEPLNFTVTVVTKHAALTEVGTPHVFPLVKGSLHFSENVTVELNNQSSVYYLFVSVNLTEGQRLTYDMIPSDQDWLQSRSIVGSDASFGFGHYSRRFTPTYSAEEDRFFAWIPRADVVNEDNSTAYAFPSDSGATYSSRSVATLVTIFSWWPPTLIAVRYWAYLHTGEFSAQGACKALNGLVTPNAENRHELFCDVATVAAIEDSVLDLLTPLACGASIVGTGVALKAKDLGTKAIAAGVGALAGLVCAENAADHLPAWVNDVITLVKKALELVGHILADILGWFETYGIPALTIIAIFLGVMLTIYSVIVPLKYIAMALMAPIAALQGYEHATDWPPYRRVHNIYLPIWSDFVERKWFGMEIHA